MDKLIMILQMWEFWLVAIALGIVGVAMKQIPKAPGWVIPLVNLVLGVIFMMALCGFTVYYAFLGILAAAIEVQAYELFIKRILNLISTEKDEKLTEKIDEEIEKVGGTDA